jgi:DNA invertase Pin-like site-specific DNA recombinase
MVLNILLSVAQWEREAIGERTRDALRHKINRRERCGKVRFGFDLASDGKTLVVNAGEQAVIRLMADLRSRGNTLREIADMLTARGIRTKEAKAAWTHTAVRRILERQAA